MNTKFLLKLFDSGFVLRFTFTLLGLSLILIGEIFFIEFVSEFWGIYFTLALVAFVSLLGLFFAYREILSKTGLIKSQVLAGLFSERDFTQLSGIFLSAVLLIIPGFITDVLGFLGFFPIVRSLYGLCLSSILPGRASEVYEYLKLYD